VRDFFGNATSVAALEQMIRQQRIPQTLLFAGPAGVGKATLARRFAAEILGSPEKIENDNLSTPENQKLLEEREKWPADKRNQDPLLFGTHPDFLTFPPDGPQRQISIHQMRLLKDRATLKPLKGDRRVFLIDQIDRAGEEAANSLLKTLEEPPDHLIIVATAQNLYDVIPTIRSRSVVLHLAPLSLDEMKAFLANRDVADRDRRLRLAEGSPGLALSLDLEAYDKRREAMVSFLKVARKKAPFADWVKHSESIGMRKNERLEYYLEILYGLLSDLLRIQNSTGEIRNQDIRRELDGIAQNMSFEWLRQAVEKVDELSGLIRRNIQKSLALDALALELRRAA
jgi:DNA polymerase-3 subunit delta'